MAVNVDLSSNNSLVNVDFTVDTKTRCTSSTSEGKIFRVRNPSENRSRTLVRPFMKVIFSSRDFDAKFDRSRKLSVDMDRDEKKG